MLLLLLLSLSLSLSLSLLGLMVHQCFGLTRVRFADLDQKVGIADPESPDAATDIPCCLVPCHVVNVVAVVAATFDFFCAQGRDWQVLGGVTGNFGWGGGEER